MPISPHVESAPHPIILKFFLQQPLLPFAIAAANNQALLLPAADTHLPCWMRPPPMPVGVLAVIISCQGQPLNWRGAAVPNPTIQTLLHPVCCPLLQWGGRTPQGTSVCSLFHSHSTKSLPPSLSPPPSPSTLVHCCRSFLWSPPQHRHCLPSSTAAVFVIVIVIVFVVIIHHHRHHPPQLPPPPSLPIAPSSIALCADVNCHHSGWLLSLPLSSSLSSHHHCRRRRCPQ